MRHALVALVMVVGCAHSVPQDAATGRDGKILSGNSDTPLVGGTATITHAEKTKATARFHPRRELVEANQNVRLTPP